MKEQAREPRRARVASRGIAGVQHDEPWLHGQLVEKLPDFRGRPQVAPRSLELEHKIAILNAAVREKVHDVRHHRFDATANALRVARFLGVAQIHHNTDARVLEDPTNQSQLAHRKVLGFAWIAWVEIVLARDEQDTHGRIAPLQRLFWRAAQDRTQRPGECHDRVALFVRTSEQLPRPLIYVGVFVHRQLEVGSQSATGLLFRVAQRAPCLCRPCFFEQLVEPQADLAEDGVGGVLRAYLLENNGLRHGPAIREGRFEFPLGIQGLAARHWVPVGPEFRAPCELRRRLFRHNLQQNVLHSSNSALSQPIYAQCQSVIDSVRSRTAGSPITM